jgi:hypothetical protein
MVEVAAALQAFPDRLVIRRREQDMDLPMIDLPLPSRWRWLRPDEPIVFHDKIEFGVVTNAVKPWTYEQALDALEKGDKLTIINSERYDRTVVAVFHDGIYCDPSFNDGPLSFEGASTNGWRYARRSSENDVTWLPSTPCGQLEKQINIVSSSGRVEPYPTYLDDEAQAVERQSKASFGRRATSV